MKKLLLSLIIFLTSLSAFSQFGDDVTIFPSPFDQKNVEFSTAFNGWVFSAVSYEDVANNKGGISIRKSTDGGETWTEIDNYSVTNTRYEAHDIIVTGTDIGSLFVSLVGVRHDLSANTFTLFNDRYNAATGAFIGSNLNKNIGNNRIYDVEIASDYLLPGVSVTPYSIAILYSRFGSTQDSINSIVSVDGGVTYTVNQNVSVTGNFFRNIALSFGKSSSGSNGRYFAAWERLNSSTSRNGNIFSSRNTSNVTSPWIAPVNLDSVSATMIGLCRNPRMATQFTTSDNDSGSVTALVTVERDFSGNGLDYDVLGFYNKRSHFTNFWNRFDVVNDGLNTLNGDLVYDNVANNFHTVYFDSVDFRLKYFRNDFQFQTPNSWTSVSSTINDTLALTRRPAARIGWNYFSNELSIAWIDNRDAGPATTAKFDSESFLFHAGLNELETKEMVIYPNPTNGLFELDFETNKPESLIIRILDLQGRIIYNETISMHESGIHQKMDLSEQKSGVYLLELRNSQGLISSQRIVKQ